MTYSQFTPSWARKKRNFGYKRNYSPAQNQPRTLKVKSQDPTKFGYDGKLYDFVMDGKVNHAYMISLKQQLTNWGLTELQWKGADGFYATLHNGASLKAANQPQVSYQPFQNSVGQHATGISQTQAVLNTLKNINAMPVPSRVAAPAKAPFKPIILNPEVPIFINRTAAFKQIRDKYNLPYGIFALKIQKVNGAGRARNRNEWADLEVIADADSPVSACRICGKTLRDHKSVASGIGPDCAKKLGALYHTYKADVKKFIDDFKIEAAKAGVMNVRIWKNQIKDNQSGFSDAIQLYLHMNSSNSTGAQIQAIKQRLKQLNQTANVSSSATTSRVINPSITSNVKVHNVVDWDGTKYPMQTQKFTNGKTKTSSTLYILNEEALLNFDRNRDEFMLMNTSTKNSVEFKAYQKPDWWSGTSSFWIGSFQGKQIILRITDSSSII